jgi:hypothetical protein
MKQLTVARVACVFFAVVSIFVLTGCFGGAEGFLCHWSGGEWREASPPSSDEWCHFPKAKSSAASSGDALFISAAAHVAGAQGTNWRSDLEVHNLGDELAVFRVLLLEHGVGNTSPEEVELSLASGRSLRLGDVLLTEFGVEGSAAMILVPSSGRIIATSRTYNLLGEGNNLGLPAGSTFGQYIPSLPSEESIRFGSQGRLIQLSHSTSADGGARANLGLVNATGAELRVKVELFTAGGERLGIVNRTLEPYEFEQLNRVFDRVTGDDVDDGYAVLSTSTPGGAFFAYASVVDNLTGDPVAISAASLPEEAPTGAGETIYVTASAHVAGAAGTNWRTDLEVHCWGSEAASYTVELLKHGRDNSNPRTESFTLDAGKSTRFEDVLESVFEFTGAAALRITPISGQLLVTSRTYNLLGEGNDLGLPAGATFGQYIPGVTGEQAIGKGEEGRLIQLSHSSDDAAGFRTNLALVNAVDRQIEVKIGLFSADGVSLGTIDRSLAPYEYRQLNKVFATVTGGDVADGYAVVKTTTEDGRFFALASVVDNSTGDPVGMGAPVISSAGTEEVLEGVEGLVHILGQTDLENIVDRAQDLDVEGLLDMMVMTQSDVASLTSDGMVLDYGSGWVAPDGTIHSGSIDVNTSGLVVSSSGINGAVIISNDDYLIDGQPPAVGSTAWTFSLTERTNGSVVGDINVGSVANLKSAGSMSGTIGIDTAICLEYPISGSLTAVVKGEEITITFSPDCDGGVSHETSGPPYETFSYGFGSPESVNALDYVAATSNAEVAHEEEGRYWRPMVGAQTLAATNPGVVTFHFPFDGSIVGGRLLVVLTNFHFTYSQGHSYLYGSTNGVDWQLLSEIEPPAQGGYNQGGWNGDLPDMFIGASDIWLEARMFSYGPRAEEGGVWCNTAQLCRWDPSHTGNTFELEVELE